MNINLKLDLPIINDKGEQLDVKVESNLFLTPFYCVEEDIVPFFQDCTEEDLPFIRQAIFQNSLQVDRLVEKVEKLKILEPKQLFSLKRDYVICATNNELAKRLNLSNLKSQSKSKTLGDFSVSVSQTGDNTVLNKIFAESAKCLRDIEALIKQAEEELVVPVDFVKGRYNSSNIQANDRLWWLKDLGVGSRVIDGYASNKFWYNGNQYKSATLNRSSLSIGRNVLDFYRRGE